MAAQLPLVPEKLHIVENGVPIPHNIDLAWRPKHAVFLSSSSPDKAAWLPHSNRHSCGGWLAVTIRETGGIRRGFSGLKFRSIPTAEERSDGGRHRSPSEKEWLPAA